MDLYEVTFFFNGTEHKVDVPAVNESDAAFRVGQHTDCMAEFRGARLVRHLPAGTICLVYVGQHRAG